MPLIKFEVSSCISHYEATMESILEPTYTVLDTSTKDVGMFLMMARMSELLFISRYNNAFTISCARITNEMKVRMLYSDFQYWASGQANRNDVRELLMVHGIGQDLWSA